MTVADFDAIAAAMAASLRSSDALQGRGPDSERWVIAIDRVRNLTSDVMTPGEQWSIMHRIQDAQPIQTLYKEKNVRFVLPAEKLRRLREQGFDAPEPVANQRQPTHSMTAIFRSGTRMQANQRTEVYFCQFALTDLRDGQAVWSDRFEFKRLAKGHIWD
jgi:hypothetical protein